MTNTSTFGLPQIVAFIASITFLLIFAIYLASKEKNDGQLKAALLAKAICFWAILHFMAWGIAGLASGNSFWESGLNSLKIIVKSIPALIKGL